MNGFAIGISRPLRLVQALPRCANKGFRKTGLHPRQKVPMGVLPEAGLLHKVNG
jgi:hypothetical protein